MEQPDYIVKFTGNIREFPSAQYEETRHYLSLRQAMTGILKDFNPTRLSKYALQRDDEPSISRIEIIDPITAKPLLFINSISIDEAQGKEHAGIHLNVPVGKISDLEDLLAVRLAKYPGYESKSDRLQLMKYHYDGITAHPIDLIWEKLRDQLDAKLRPNELWSYETRITHEDTSRSSLAQERYYFNSRGKAMLSLMQQDFNSMCPDYINKKGILMQLTTAEVYDNKTFHRASLIYVAPTGEADTALKPGLYLYDREDKWASKMGLRQVRDGHPELFRIADFNEDCTELNSTPRVQKILDTFPAKLSGYLLRIEYNPDYAHPRNNPLMEATHYQYLSKAFSDLFQLPNEKFQNGEISEATIIEHSTNRIVGTKFMGEGYENIPQGVYIKVNSALVTIDSLKAILPHINKKDENAAHVLIDNMSNTRQIKRKRLTTQGHVSNPPGSHKSI